MTFIGISGLSLKRFMLTQKKKLVVHLEIPEAKKKLRRSADEAMRNGGGGKLSIVGGKSTLPETSFPIIGIDASAGGLEAPELFRANVPAQNGMAFVIVQHLDPTYKGMLVELLQRLGTLPSVSVRKTVRIAWEGPGTSDGRKK